MAVKCILTGQTPSVLDGVTENVQTQIDDKQSKITVNGILKGDGNGNISAAVKGTDYDTEVGTVHYQDSFDSVEAAYFKYKTLRCSEYPQGQTTSGGEEFYTLLKRDESYTTAYGTVVTYTFVCLNKTIILTRKERDSTSSGPVDTWEKGSMGYNPRTHASTHKTGGSDAIALSDIGAQAKITANGVLKGDGLGNISAATATDIPGLDAKQDKIFEKVDGDTYNLDKDFILQHNGESDLLTISGDVRTLSSVNSAISISTNRANLSTASGGFEVSYDEGTTKNTFEFVEASKITGIPAPTEDTDAANKTYVDAKQDKITANGVLRGDGSGNITAANETEVELVSLPNICNPNLIVNWYFPNPVNQRGKAEYTGSGGVGSSNVYGIDRWAVQFDGTKYTVATATLSSTSETNVGQMNYMLPNNEAMQFVGKQMTFSLLVDNPDGVNVTLNVRDRTRWSHLLPAKTGGGSLITTTGVFGTLNSGEGVQASFSIPHGTSIVPIAVKLELGGVQTLAHQDADGKWVLNEIPDYGEQLLKCQRYLRPAGTLFITSQASGNIYGSTSLVSSYPMRAVPRIVNADYMGVEVREVTGGVAGTITNVFTPNINGSFTVQLSGTSIPNYVYIDPTGFNPLLSAEL